MIFCVGLWRWWKWESGGGARGATVAVNFTCLSPSLRFTGLRFWHCRHIKLRSLCVWTYRGGEGEVHCGCCLNARKVSREMQDSGEASSVDEVEREWKMYAYPWALWMDFMSVQRGEKRQKVCGKITEISWASVELSQGLSCHTVSKHWCVAS